MIASSSNCSVSPHLPWFYLLPGKFSDVILINFSQFCIWEVRFANLLYGGHTSFCGRNQTLTGGAGGDADCGGGGDFQWGVKSENGWLLGNTFVLGKHASLEKLITT